jgi:hypothetical protein
MHNNNLFKKYRTFKTNNYIRKNPFLFFFQSNKSKSIIWKKNEQILTKLKLVYYKLINKIALKTLKVSIYKNFTSLICGVILLVKSNTKRIDSYKTIESLLIKDFSLLCVKLNNKFYSINEMKNFQSFSYKKNIFFLYQMLEKYAKISCIINNKNKKSK